MAQHKHDRNTMDGCEERLPPRGTVAAPGRSERPKGAFWSLLGWIFWLETSRQPSHATKGQKATSLAWFELCGSDLRTNLNVYHMCGKIKSHTYNDLVYRNQYHNFYYISKIFYTKLLNIIYHMIPPRIPSKGHMIVRHAYIYTPPRIPSTRARNPFLLRFLTHKKLNEPKSVTGLRHEEETWRLGTT